MYSRSSLYTGLKFCWADECVSVPPGKEGQEQGGLLLRQGMADRRGEGADDAW